MSKKETHPFGMEDIITEGKKRFGNRDNVKPEEIVDYVNDLFEGIGLPRTFDIKQLQNILIDNGASDNKGNLSELVMKMFHPGYGAN